jgi:hypothetical protein
MKDIDLAMVARSILDELGTPPANLYDYYTGIHGDPIKKRLFEENSARLAVALAASGMVNTGMLIRENITELHKLATWAAWSFPIFDLTHSLAAGLMLTEPSEEEPHLPFPVFMIRIPDGSIPIWDGQNMKWANRAWVHRYDAPVGDGNDTFGPETTAEEINRFAVKTQLRLSANREDGLSCWVYGPAEAINQAAEKLKNKPVEITSGFDPPPMPEDDLTRAALSTVILNLCSWIESKGGPGEPTRKIKPPAEVLEKPSLVPPPSPDLWVFGREVKLAPEIRQAAKDMVLGATGRSAGWKLRARFVVRSHIRMQPHGPGRSLRRPQWIEPHWKGPEKGMEWSHLYKL